jgi:hypothetical protein
MSRRNRRPLADRVVEAAEKALAAQKYVSPLDVLLGVGWLNGSTASDWQQGKVESLERVIQTSPERVAEAMVLLTGWARSKGLIPSPAQYLARTPQRQPLRFSADGDAEVEQVYHTHWVSPALPGKQRERVVEKANRPPELVVIQPLNREWTCHRCGGSGGLLMMENPGPACLKCVGLDHLEFLPAGDALLTRRAKAKSVQYAVVVRFSRARKRYERQGLLLEPQALAEAERELAVSSREG